MKHFIKFILAAFSLLAALFFWGVVFTQIKDFGVPKVTTSGIRIGAIIMGILIASTLSYLTYFLAVRWGSTKEEPHLQKKKVEIPKSSSNAVISKRVIAAPPITQIEGVADKPLQRFFARLFDIFLFGLAINLIGYIYVYLIGASDASSILDRYIYFFMWGFSFIFVCEIFSLTLLGTTPGKALLGIKLRFNNGDRPGFLRVIKRTIRVYAWGFGLFFSLAITAALLVLVRFKGEALLGGGLDNLLTLFLLLPLIAIASGIVCFITWIISYIRLAKRGYTSWDEKGNIEVSCQNLGVGRVSSFIILLPLILFSSYWSAPSKNLVQAVTNAPSKAYSEKDIIYTEDGDGLMKAIRSGNKAKAIELLNTGVDPNVRDKLGVPALQRAVVDTDESVMVMLISKGANINAVSNNVVTALQEAAYFGFTSKANLLISNGANIHSKDKRGTTPLIAAAQPGHYAVMELLISKGADINAKDNDGNTPLLFAAHSGQKRAVELLLSKGADTKAVNIHDTTFLHMAVDSGKTEVVEIALANGGDIKARDKDGKTPLGRAEGNPRSKDVAEFLEKYSRK